MKTKMKIRNALGGLMFMALVALLTAGHTATVSADTIIMDRTINDGSFESNPVYNVNDSPTTLPPVWTITSAGPNRGGLLSNPPHGGVLAGADGVSGLFADGPTSPNVTTATSANLLDGAYPAVSAGDVFTWSFMVNSAAANSTGALKLNFGAGDVIVGSGTAGDTDISTFATVSGTYTATAADAASGQLRVKFSIATGTGGVVNIYGDNVRLSVLHGPTSFQENFSSWTLPPRLEAILGIGGTCCGGQVSGPVFENFHVRFQGEDTRGDGSGNLRSYLRTKSSDYSSVDFVAEVTVTIPPNRGVPNVGRNSVFFGLASCELDPTVPWGAIKPDGVQLIVQPSNFGPSIIGVDGTGPDGINPSSVQDLNCGGDGTYRLRMVWSASTKRMVLSVQRNYTGGPFQADCTLPPIDGSNNRFNASNARIFIGGDWNAVFEDLRVIRAGLPVTGPVTGNFEDGPSPGLRVRMQSLAARGQTFAVQTSSNLVHWVNLGYQIVGPKGQFDFLDQSNKNGPGRFYRLGNADAAGSALRIAGSNANAVYAALKTNFGLGFENAHEILVEAGFSATDALAATLPDMKGFYSAIIREKGPVIRLHPDERYLPSSLDWALDRSTLEDNLGRRFIVNLDNLTEVSDTAISTGANETWLRSIGDQKLGGDLASTKSYVHILRQPAYTDLQFWMFYPYNGPGTLRVGLDPSYGMNWNPNGTQTEPIGEHFGDWEVVILRLDNTTHAVTKVIMSQHGDYPEYDPSQLEYQNGHLVVYSSLNGHAIYPYPGDNSHAKLEKTLTLPEYRVDLGCIPRVCTPGFCLIPNPFTGDCEVYIPEVCTPEACIRFDTPSIRIATFKVELLNRCAGGGPTWAASDRFEIVGVYDGSLDVDVFAPGNPGSSKHWMQFRGSYSPVVNLQLSHEVTRRILLEQTGPVADLLCRNSVFVWGSPAFAVCSAIDLIPGLPSPCGPIENLLRSGCNAVIAPFFDQIPQAWINTLVDALYPGGSKAARPESPGVRQCGVVIQAGDAVNPEWIYIDHPKDGRCP